VRPVARDAPRDPGRLRQILLNLVSNAIKFHVRGEVELRASPGGGRGDGEAPLRSDGARLGDRDGGVGAGEAVLGVHPATGDGRRFGGTGLGLMIARRLVE